MTSELYRQALRDLEVTLVALREEIESEAPLDGPFFARSLQGQADRLATALESEEQIDVSTGRPTVSKETEEAATRRGRRLDDAARKVC